MSMLQLWLKLVKEPFRCHFVMTLQSQTYSKNHLGFVSSAVAIKQEKHLETVLPSVDILALPPYPLRNTSLERKPEVWRHGSVQPWTLCFPPSRWVPQGERCCSCSYKLKLTFKKKRERIKRTAIDRTQNKCSATLKQNNNNHQKWNWTPSRCLWAVYRCLYTVWRHRNKTPVI